MNRRLVIYPAAENDIAAAAQWYEEQGSSKLSLEFRSALDQTFSSIKENPELYARAYRSLRRALLRRFPYGVFYVPRPERVVVLAVLHTSRNPKLWRTRLQRLRSS
jgi:plasmid stabilization system protein ParE